MMRLIKTKILAISLMTLAFVVTSQTANAKISEQSYYCPPWNPDTRESMKKGQEAAKRGDWKNALKEFQAAAWSAPYAPAVLFNNGKIYDNMGRELDAIRHYNAFLVAAPKARNVPQVRGRIKELQASVRDKAKRLLVIVEDAARQHPKGSFEHTSSMTGIAEAYAAMGEIRKALAIAAKMDSHKKSRAISGIASAQAMWGDFDGAKQISNDLLPVRGLMTNYKNIAKYMAWEGDVANALEGAIELESVALKGRGFDRKLRINRLYKFRAEAYLEIVDRLLWVGKKVQANSVLEKAVIDTDRIKDKRSLLQYSKTKLYGEISKRWVQMGDLEKAKNAAREASIEKVDRNAYKALTAGLTAAGDIQGAQTVFGKIAKKEPRLKYLISVVEKAQKAVQDASPGPEKKDAEENLKRCTRVVMRNYALPLNQNKTLDQLEIETWSPQSGKGLTSDNIQKSFDFKKAVSFIQELSANIVVSQGIALVNNMMKELANHRRITIDFQKRRGNLAAN